MDLNRMGQRLVRPAVESLRLEWYGWHAKPHVTKERYIKAFDPAVLAAMKTLEATLDDFHKCSATVQQVN
jgi:hypothetical protein